MIEASCHCGALKLQIEAAPQTVTHCNCSICRRFGTLCSYYSPKQVSITGATDTYMWGDKSIVFHRCKNCGCFAYWLAVDKSYDRMGVNARLMAPEVLAAAAVREFDGASM
ncbi:MAG TPA: GFA family protein [Rhizomicrobium sp.]|jgi:hypothetical protein|nr:GFA family protein [Rhizomicrobium sp.]